MLWWTYHSEFREEIQVIFLFDSVMNYAIIIIFDEIISIIHSPSLSPSLLIIFPSSSPLPPFSLINFDAVAHDEFFIVHLATKKINYKFL